MTGGAGSDTFLYRQGDFGAAETILDFNAEEGDVLAIGALLQGYTALDAHSFIRLQETGQDTLVQVDVDGEGGDFGFEDLVLLQGVTGPNLDALLQQGSIDTAQLG